MTRTETDAAFKALGLKIGSTVVAELLRVAWERDEDWPVSVEDFCAWAAENVDVDYLWDRLGQIVDELEHDARSSWRLVRDFV